MKKMNNDDLAAVFARGQSFPPNLQLQRLKVISLSLEVENPISPFVVSLW